MYFAFFHSYLTYYMLTWFPLLTQLAQSKLITLQKKIIRGINNAPFRQHCMPFFKSDNILTLVDQLKYDNVKFVFRLTQKQCPVPLCNLFIWSDRKNDTRGIQVKCPNHKSSLVNKFHVPTLHRLAAVTY